MYVACIHSGGIILSALWFWHRYYGIEAPFWRLGWVREFWQVERNIEEWLVIITLVLCTWVLWSLGRRLGVNPTDQTTVSQRFDTGLAFLLALLLIKLLIAVKSSAVPVAHSSTEAIISFMILGLFSMGFVRTLRKNQPPGTAYFKGAGIVLSFTAIILMLGGGLIVLFLPELKTIAGVSADLLKTATAPLGPVVIALIRFIFGGSYKSSPFPSPEKDGLPPIIAPLGVEPGFLHYLFMGLAVAALLGAAVFVLYHFLGWVFKWLFSTTEESKRTGIWKYLWSCLHAAKRIIATLWAKFFHPPAASLAVETFYKRLLRWGRFSGLPHVDSETPREYGVRLGQRFPQIEQEIGIIIHLHNETLYGCLPPDGRQVSLAMSGLKRIRYPSLWFVRLKSILFYSGSRDVEHDASSGSGR